MGYIDVFSKYYAFSKSPRDNKYYEMKKANYEKAVQAFRNDEAVIDCKPFRATLQTTDFCNLNCIMCQIHSQRDRHRLQKMSRQQFDIIAEKLFPYLIEVHPTNVGEPLMSEWFDYLCDKAVEYGVLLDITTNGTLLTEQKISKILPNLLDIKISFDAMDKGIFERIRRNADYEAVRRNLDMLLEMRGKSACNGSITLQMTLFDFNYNELPEVIRFAKAKGVDRVKGYHVHSYSSEIDKHSPFNNLEGFEQVRKYSIKLAEELGIALELSEPPNATSKPTGLVPQKCRLPWGECFIDSDGEVYSCHTHGHRSMGNIYQLSMPEIWDGQYATFLRKSLIDCSIRSNCSNCGMNYMKVDENQPVPYNLSGFLHSGEPADSEIRWSSRNKQFLLNR
ncbi:MAG: radical SAM protein [Bacteroidales bacterium]|nr:radical SAM protein [Bacteroidales bacterium]